MEWLAEWSLNPTNVAFLRVHTGIYDPTQIGDKSKWFAESLDVIKFNVWSEGSSLGAALRAASQLDNVPTGKVHTTKI